MRPLRCLEMSGTIYSVTRLYITEELIPHPHCCENIKLAV